MGNRRYNHDFRHEAVRMAEEEGLALARSNEHLGITQGILKGWVQKHRDHQEAAFVVRVAPGSPEAALKRLCKEKR